LYKRIIAEHRNSPAAQMAEEARTALSYKHLRKGSIGGIRPDVVLYLKEALALFQKVPHEDYYPRRSGRTTARSSVEGHALLGSREGRTSLQ
jgi:hypothetical protein